MDFKTDLARKAFGHTIDRIYYRGLTLEEALVVEVDSSDHNPLLVRFRLTDEDWIIGPESALSAIRFHNRTLKIVELLIEARSLKFYMA